ncbi:MAG TPA: Mur ligase family protein [Polyangiaceae bacterium]|jgi:UDP-N-acetylmuramate: L-alanyl-gamma-D-glutamyl-meso-diaminopimelate ligase|nr:Mur ligase family protein [Polyangiaceae bacterium]
MRIHVVGVAGAGMGSLAGLLAELGHDVTGSDVAFDPPIGPSLAGWGVGTLKGFHASNLVPAPELVVIGNVCRKDNPEARAAIDGGLPYTHIAGALADLVLGGTRPLVVAGTHGKTTTTALAAWLLDGAGRNPGFLVGGIPANFGRSFRAPRRRLPVAGDTPSAERPPFVIEGDEYDTAFFEKTAKFLHYRAEVAIVTSIEHDHVDIYPTLDSYHDAFRRFIAQIPPSGLVVANAADPVVVELVGNAARADVAWYALEGEPNHGVAPRWLGAMAGSDARATSFDLYAGGVAAGRLSVPLAGRHNVSNSVAAIGAVVEGYGVKIHELARPLSRFAGVKRRQEVLGEPRGITVIDDFAHHPTAVRETLAALRARYAGRRLVAVFEPRSATACRAMHQEQYTESFDAADEVLLAPVGRKGIADETLDVERLARDLTLRGKTAAAYPDVDAIVKRLVETATTGDVIALLSNGAFGGIHGRLLTALAGR